MQRSYLLPYVCKKVGMWMSVPFFALCLWLILSGELELDCFKLPALAVNVESLGEGHASWFKIVETDPVNEIAMLGLLVSLCLVALSKEKDEDEMTGAVRMRSFVWSFWVTAAVLAFGIVFFYDFSFLYFVFAAIYFVFMLYIVRFNWEMQAARRGKE